jgi:hypothetical protein
MDQDNKAIISTQGRDNTALEPELAEAVRRVIAAAESENTRRAYATQFAKIEAWCARRSTSALPETRAVVGIYLTDLASTGADPSKPAKGAKVATVGLALSPRLTAPPARPRHEGPRDPGGDERHSEEFRGASGAGRAA